MNNMNFVKVFSTFAFGIHTVAQTENKLAVSQIERGKRRPTV